jgi:hypothetical protein
MSKIIDSLRNVWSSIKTTVAKLHITSAVQVIDFISNATAKIEPGVEIIKKLEGIAPIPEPYKTEIAAILNVAIPVMKTVANEPLLKGIYNDLRLGLAAEVANILSGKVHALATIKADIQSLFDNEIKAVTTATATA